MAGLLLCLWSVVFTSCLIPQDDQIAGDLPPRRNTPLRIVDTTPSEPQTSYDTRCAAGMTEFSVKVFDEDVTDTINSLWFIDKGPNTVPFTTTPRIPMNTTTRTVSAPTALTFTNALSNLSLGKHLLTVYVADGFFNEVVSGEVTVQDRMVMWDGGVLTDKSYIDSFTWSVEVVRCP
ncbi:MAG: hypothetical protein U0228_11900 [Myxococcaceae bacterium]